MTSFKVPTSLLHPMTGNQTIIAMWTYAKNLGAPSKTHWGFTTYYNIQEIDLIDFITVQLVVSVWWEVEWLPMYIKMSKSHADITNVPNSLPDAVNTDEDGTETQIKRIDYRPWGREPKLFDNDLVYVVEWSWKKDYFTWSQYVLISQDSNIIMMTRREFNTYQWSFNIDSDDV